jgi:hypothetical protein
MLDRLPAMEDPPPSRCEKANKALCIQAAESVEKASGSPVFLAISFSEVPAKMKKQLALLLLSNIPFLGRFRSLLLVLLVFLREISKRTCEENCCNLR